MLISFDLENENNHENLEEQEDIPFDYFLQSTAFHCMVTKLLEAPFTQQCRYNQVKSELCLAEIWLKILLSDQIGIELKK
jgi:hypothetical protein